MKRGAKVRAKIIGYVVKDNYLWVESHKRYYQRGEVVDLSHLSAEQLVSVIEAGGVKPDPVTETEGEVENPVVE